MTDHELDCILTRLKTDDFSELGSVRGQVMARIVSGRRRSGRRRGVWFLMAAAAAVMVIILAVPRGGGRGAIAPPELLPPRTPGFLAPPLDQSSQAANRVPKRHHQEAIPIAKRPRKAGPLEVRMQTDDPDVLIIWLVDE